VSYLYLIKVSSSKPATLRGIQIRVFKSAKQKENRKETKEEKIGERDSPG
jgi:hypothetical protein